MIRALKRLNQRLHQHLFWHQPDFTRPFKLQTDWQPIAIAAVLSQADKDGLERAICYSSRKLHGAELNYSPSEGECLAVLWGVKKYHAYLHGREFIIQTDHQALVALMTTKDLTGKLARWSMKLQGYNFTIQYRPGHAHANADGLSRLPPPAAMLFEIYMTSGTDVYHSDDEIFPLKPWTESMMLKNLHRAQSHTESYATRNWQYEVSPRVIQQLEYWVDQIPRPYGIPGAFFSSLRLPTVLAEKLRHYSIEGDGAAVDGVGPDVALPAMETISPETPSAGTFFTELMHRHVPVPEVDLLQQLATRTPVSEDHPPVVTEPQDLIEFAPADDDEDAPHQQRACALCNTFEPSEDLIQCFNCNARFHATYCLHPAVLLLEANDEWLCGSCDGEGTDNVHGTQDITEDTGVLHYLKTGTTPEVPLKERRRIKRRAKNFQIKDSQLYRKPCRRFPIARLVPAIDQRKEIALNIHAVAHARFERMTASISQKYYWAAIGETVKEVLTACLPCATMEKDLLLPKELHPIPAFGVLQRWHIDTVGKLHRTSAGNQYMITAYEACSKWVEAGAIPNKSAACTKEFVWANLICRFGAPE